MEFLQLILEQYGLIGFVFAIFIFILWQVFKRQDAMLKEVSNSKAKEREADTEQQRTVTKMALTTSEAVGSMQDTLLQMATDLGVANTKIAVLTERETTREQLWSEKFNNLNEKLGERDESIRVIKHEKSLLESDRERLLKRNETLLTDLRAISERLAICEAKLKLYEDASRKEITQPIPDMATNEAVQSLNTPDISDVSKTDNEDSEGLVA